MSFLVFLLILALGTLFVAVSIQIRHMALEGKKPWGHVPTFLAKKLSSGAYAWVCGGIGWALVIIGGLIYNSTTLKDPGGPFWCAIYLSILSGFYTYLWLRNRKEDLKP